MGNVKGETQFTSGGKEYKLKFTFNAYCDLEDSFDLSIQQILKRLETASKKGDFSLRDIRKMMRCGLSHFHPGILNDEAGRIIEGLGNRMEAFDFVTSAFIAGFGGDEEKSKKEPGDAAEIS